MCGRLAWVAVRQRRAPFGRAAPGGPMSQAAATAARAKPSSTAGKRALARASAMQGWMEGGRYVPLGDMPLRAERVGVGMRVQAVAAVHTHRVQGHGPPCICKTLIRDPLCLRYSMHHSPLAEHLPRRCACGGGKRVESAAAGQGVPGNDARQHMAIIGPRNPRPHPTRVMNSSASSVYICGREGSLCINLEAALPPGLVAHLPRRQHHRKPELGWKPLSAACRKRPAYRLHFASQGPCVCPPSGPPAPAPSSCRARGAWRRRCRAAAPLAACRR